MLKIASRLSSSLLVFRLSLFSFSLSTLSLATRFHFDKSFLLKSQSSWFRGETRIDQLVRAHAMSKKVEKHLPEKSQRLEKTMKVLFKQPKNLSTMSR